MQALIQLQDEQHQMQSDLGIIGNIFVKFYQKLLGERGGARGKAHAGVLTAGPVLRVEEQLS